MLLGTIEKHGKGIVGGIVGTLLVVWTELTGKDISGQGVAVLWMSLTAVIQGVQTGIRAYIKKKMAKEE